MNIKRYIKFSWSKTNKRDDKETITKGELIINNYREIFLFLMTLLLLLILFSKEIQFEEVLKSLF